MKEFNIRVYAFIIHPQKGLLLSHEKGYGKEFIKFPGGGLDWGEGPLDTLKRELKEELNLAEFKAEPAYISEEFILSVFDDSQVIGIYYLLDSVDYNYLGTLEGEREILPEEDPHIHYQRIFWEEDFEKALELLTFEMDKTAWSHFIKNLSTKQY